MKESIIDCSLPFAISALFLFFDSSSDGFSTFIFQVSLHQSTFSSSFEFLKMWLLAACTLERSTALGPCCGRFWSVYYYTLPTGRFLPFRLQLVARHRRKWTRGFYFVDSTQLASFATRITCCFCYCERRRLVLCVIPPLSVLHDYFHWKTKRLIH